MRIHSLAWVGWLVSVLILLTAARNPLLLMILWMILGVIQVSGVADPADGEGETDTPQRAGPGGMLLGSMVVLAGLFNGLTSHYGATVLLHIPGQIPLLSGDLTLEALVYGLINGLTLGGIFLAFSIVNHTLPVRAIMRLIPQAFYPAALVLSIALTFSPTLMRRVTEIREAQAIRGLQVRGLRDWGPLLLPLLIDSLERAFQLAEAMTARGLAITTSPVESRQDLTLMGGGLVGFCAGWVMSLSNAPEGLALTLWGVSGLIILTAIGRSGRRSKRSSYRVEPWSPVDGWILIGCAAALALNLLPGLADGLAYSPYPKLSLPHFQLLGGIGLLGLLLPIAGAFRGRK